ncbi:uncharacterized protein LOC109504513 isoform X2 [Harpegnathos saltator]|uniref:uncharacterized protein LOC109504513 isoform X2 n=1 Tax=Harpegnathos saltator TaxID=610380 RepID=UPI000DBED74A|nr:uncharacterized protein LOC109504513 isoform X2 [Harpegnathos saltator]
MCTAVSQFFSVVYCILEVRKYRNGPLYAVQKHCGSENEAGKVVTVNVERYRDIISNSLWLKLSDFDNDDITGSQDLAT